MDFSLLYRATSMIGRLIVKFYKNTQITVDQRFGAMFQKNSQFNNHLVRNRYGQKKNLTKKERAQILRFYENENEDEKGLQAKNAKFDSF